jgi:hypothetical protein
MLLLFNFDSKYFKRRKTSTRSKSKRAKGGALGDVRIEKDFPLPRDDKTKGDIIDLSKIFNDNIIFFRTPLIWNGNIVRRYNDYYKYKESKLYRYIKINDETGSLVVNFLYEDTDNDKKVYINCPFHFTFYFENPINWPHITTEYDNISQNWCSNIEQLTPLLRSTKTRQSQKKPHTPNSVSHNHYSSSKSRYQHIKQDIDKNIRMYIVDAKTLDDLIESFREKMFELFITIQVEGCQYTDALVDSYLLASQSMVDMLTKFKEYIKINGERNARKAQTVSTAPQIKAREPLGTSRSQNAGMNYNTKTKAKPIVKKSVTTVKKPVAKRAVRKTPLEKDIAKLLKLLKIPKTAKVAKATKAIPNATKAIPKVAKARKAK